MELNRVYSYPLQSRPSYVLLSILCCPMYILHPMHEILYETLTECSSPTLKRNAKEENNEQKQEKAFKFNFLLSYSLTSYIFKPSRVTSRAESTLTFTYTLHSQHCNNFVWPGMIIQDE